MEFAKMQGAGNDYIYLNCMEWFPNNPAKLAVSLSDRHFGIGGDGVIYICPSDRADLSMRMFNADGSEGLMCGNGIRCAAKYAYEKGLTQNQKIIFETKSGLREVELQTNGERITGATVNMGVPVLGKQMCISVKGVVYTGVAVSVGNQHFVVQVPDVTKIELGNIGSKIENACSFESGVNVEFVQILNRGEIQMRVWERGSGETLACGTGACASVAVLASMGCLDRKAKVFLPGGVLDVCWHESEDRLLLSGPAVTVFEGTVRREIYIASQ